MLGEGSKEYGYLYVSTEDVKVSLTIQRLQKSSPPVGGTFRIHLPHTVISGKRRHIQVLDFLCRKPREEETILNLGNAQVQAARLNPPS